MWCGLLTAVTWYKGVRELTYCQRYRILAENDGHFMMQIPSTMKQDSGEFTITASNTAGSVNFTTFVSILPPQPGAVPAASDLDWSVLGHYSALPFIALPAFYITTYDTDLGPLENY